MTFHTRVWQDTMRTSTSRFMLVLLVLGSMAACDRGPTDAEPEPIASQITVFEGDNQIAAAGSWIPLSVRVTDSGNRGVPNVTVYWQVTSGVGELASSLQPEPFIQSFTVTNADGVARVFVQLTVLGTSAVTASVAGLQGPPVTFTTTVTKPVDVVIHFGPMFDCEPNDPSRFTVGDTAASVVTVPLGSKVEWVYTEWVHPSCQARITSSSVPRGGEPFDSGIMSPGQRFQFVPGVPGTWTYRDALNGGGGTLTVTPAPKVAEDRDFGSKKFVAAEQGELIVPRFPSIAEF